MDENKVRYELSELEALFNRITEALFESDILHDDYQELVYKYRERKAELFLVLGSGKKLPRVHDAELRERLNRFYKNGEELIQRFKKDNRLREFAKILEEEIKPEFSREREEELESNLFYSRFNGLDYVYGIINTGTIIIKNLTLPKELEPLIYELRQCIIFQNYLAAGVMLRTVADVAVTNIVEVHYPNEAKQFETFGERLDFLKSKNRFMIPSEALNHIRTDLNK